MTAIPENVLRKALEAATDDKPVLASEVQWDLRNPCADCPFIKSSPFHQGVAKSLPSVVEMIDENRFAHTCHKTDTRKQCDGPVAGKETGRPVQHCIGSILMLLKTGKGKDLQLPLLQAVESGKLSLDDLARLRKRARSDSNVFTVRGLLAYYHDRIARMLRK